jgi:hypothetical protein
MAMLPVSSRESPADKEGFYAQRACGERDRWYSLVPTQAHLAHQPSCILSIKLGGRSHSLQTTNLASRGKLLKLFEELAP